MVFCAQDEIQIQDAFRAQYFLDNIEKELEAFKIALGDSVDFARPLSEVLQEFVASVFLSISG